MPWSSLLRQLFAVLACRLANQVVNSKNHSGTRFLQAPAGVASTTLKSAVVVGVKSLPVNSQVGFTVGMLVDIDSGTETWEVNRVFSSQSDVLSLASPLKYAHVADATVATQVICKLPYSTATTANWNQYPCQKRWNGDPDIYAGQTCITQCDVGWIPDTPLLGCRKSTFVLEPASFVCQPAKVCTNPDPASIENANTTTTCAGSQGTTQSGANCSTQCAQYYKGFPSMVQCSDGRWNVSSETGIFFNGDEVSTGSYVCSKEYDLPISSLLTNPPITTPAPAADGGIIVGGCVAGLCSCGLLGICCYVAKHDRKKILRVPLPTAEELRVAEFDTYGKKKSPKVIKALVIKAKKAKKSKDPILDHKQKRGFRAIRIAI